MCREAVEVQKAAMASQALADLAGSVANPLYGMVLYNRDTKRVLMDTREEHMDNKYRCTPNCIGKATTSMVLPNQRDPTMSDLPHDPERNWSLTIVQSNDAQCRCADGPRFQDTDCCRPAGTDIP